MRIYQNCMEMLSEVHRDLFEMGQTVKPRTMQDKNIEGNEDFETLELSSYPFAIESPLDIDEMIQHRGLNIEWCRRDFEERTSTADINPGEAYKLREEWEEFVHGGKFAYTYNERLIYQLRETIKLLKFDPDTRQAVITIYEGGKDVHNRGGIKRVPCSMYYQFMVRNGALDCVYTMRSSDFMTHFPYDIWHAVMLQNLIAKEIGFPAGKLTFFSGSLHAYKKDVPKTF